jgi:hypothetical protein
MTPHSMTSVAVGPSSAGRMSLLLIFAESLLKGAKMSAAMNRRRRMAARMISPNAIQRAVVLSISPGKNRFWSQLTRRRRVPGGAAGTGTSGIRAMGGHCQCPRLPQRQEGPCEPAPDASPAHPSAESRRGAVPRPGPGDPRPPASSRASASGRRSGCGGDPSPRSSTSRATWSSSASASTTCSSSPSSSSSSPWRRPQRRRLLFWGIAGAIVMRSAFLIAGIGAINRFARIIPVFGAFILLTGFRVAAGRGARTPGGPGNPAVRFIPPARPGQRWPRWWPSRPPTSSLRSIRCPP